MKKRMSRILAALLTLTLVVSTAEVVNAEDVSETGEEIQITEEIPEEELTEELPELPELSESEGEKAESVKGDMFKTLAGTVNGDIGYKEISSTSEVSTISAGTVNFSNANDYYYKQITVPAKGIIIMYAQYTSSISNSYLIFGLADANFTKTIAAGMTYAGSQYSYYMMEVTQPGTYTLAVQATAPGQATGLRACYIRGGDRAVSDGTIIVGQKSKRTDYYSYKAPYTGYVAMATSLYGSTIALCNAAKTQLSGTTSMNGKNDVVYGIEKGKTYYIKVWLPDNDQGIYAFALKSGKISEKSGKKKSKAVTIKKAKTKKGTIQPGSSQADWYKFKLTGKKSVKFYFSGRSNDGLKITIYKGGKKIGTQSLSSSSSSVTFRSGGKWTKGTYYMKVQRATKYSSGWYAVKWK